MRCSYYSLTTNMNNPRYEYALFFIRLFGHWPFDNVKKNLVIRTIIMINNMVGVLTFTAKLFTSETNIRTFIEVIPLLTTAIIFALCNIIHFVERYENKMKCMWKMIETTWDSHMYDGEREILIKYTQEGNKFCKFFTGLVHISCAAYVPFMYSSQILDIINPLNESRPLYIAYPVEYFLNLEEHFSLIMLHAHFVAVLALAVLTCQQTIFVTLIQHISAKFSMLGFRLKYVLDRELHFDLTEGKSDPYYREIIICIKRHQEAKRFAGIADEFYSCLVAIQLFAVVIVISGTAVSAMNTATFEFRAIAFVCCQLVYLIMGCYIGQRLIDASLNVSVDAYNSCWYKRSVATQRLLLLLLLNSYNPSAISTYNFFFVSLEYCRKALQTMVSYCTLYQNLQ